MKELIVATKNSGKAAEFREMFSKYTIEVKSLLDFDDPVNDIEETGTSFEENAAIKSEAICSKFNVPVLADDSGLVIDALNGEPGVYSARYAGEEKDDQKNIEKVMAKLKDVPENDRTARFICAIAVSRPDKETFIKVGKCEGSIALEERGNHGFGYDPIFIPNGSNRTLAEHTPEEKNSISHRKNAILQVEGWLKAQS
ncbi:XTP/dITP diphosphatase [Halobacillus salinarum]|uniref:dITP/XTP pyrophosphatase n=1 Tax=Halobacillus salinarum TaxID=2932257 RepID=A0ABY4ERA4_9BACI|nr:XTP/dITP diphosphatase [Halobacillus salinarum]UOQ46437.1 XTP/dITP diphosphatase [Halobacillus salinarum]